MSTQGKHFISHANADDVLVRWWVRFLYATGAIDGEIFYAEDHIRVGEAWSDRIVSEVHGATAFHLFWSASARDSSWVGIELSIALERTAGGKSPPRFLRPYIIDSTPLPQCVEDHFQDLKLPTKRPPLWLVLLAALGALDVLDRTISAIGRLLRYFCAPASAGGAKFAAGAGALVVAAALIETTGTPPLDPTGTMAFVLIPAGTFQMGSLSSDVYRKNEGPVRPVSVSEFYMSTTEVTQGQWRAVMGTSQRCKTYEGLPLVGDELPQTCVGWLGAVRYANRLSELSGLTPAYQVSGQDVTWDRTSNGFRLPTEAEWEYAARAGTTTVWPGATNRSELCRIGNVGDQLARAHFPKWFTFFDCNDGYTGPAPVGRFLANPWGLYDMIGNAKEWCWDWYADDAYASDEHVNPSGPSKGNNHVVRGLSWYDGHQESISYRTYSPIPASAMTGFRLVRSERGGQ